MRQVNLWKTTVLKLKESTKILNRLSKDILLYGYWLEIVIGKACDFRI